MKKLIVIVAAMPVLLLAKCASVRVAHDHAARRLLQTLTSLSLPPEAQGIEERSEVGGFISGTGDAIDVLAYRVFTSNRPEAEVSQFYADYLKRTKEDANSGVFRLDTPEGSRTGVTESCLRRMIASPKVPTYVLYSADRIDDGTWDWRGW